MRPLRIFDVGTGTGQIALVLARLGHEVTGFDVSPAMVRACREKAERASANLVHRT